MMPPLERANSRIPFTESWLSKVNSRRLSCVKGKDSQPSLSPPDVLGVKTRMYSPGLALK